MEGMRDPLRCITSLFLSLTINFPLSVCMFHQYVGRAEHRKLCVIRMKLSERRKKQNNYFKCSENKIKIHSSRVHDWIVKMYGCKKSNIFNHRQPRDKRSADRQKTHVKNQR